MEQIVVEATLRKDMGKNASRRIRRRGAIPAIVYGAKNRPVAIEVNPRKVMEILRSPSGYNTIFTLNIAGEGKANVMVKDWQVDPVRETLLHVDLIRVAMTERLRVNVPVLLAGEAKGVKVQGGVLEQVTREVEIECLPTDIPDQLTADVSELMIGKQLRVGELVMDPKLKVLTDPDRVIAHVVSVKEEVVPTAEAVVEAAPVEPEVIKKGKAAAEEEEEAAPAGPARGGAGREGEAEPAKKEKEKK
jgi:large subunit ribosomal protein L25